MEEYNAGKINDFISLILPALQSIVIKNTDFNTDLTFTNYATLGN